MLAAALAARLLLGDVFVDPENTTTPAATVVDPENTPTPIGTAVDPENTPAPAAPFADPENAPAPAGDFVDPENAPPPAGNVVDPESVNGPAEGRTYAPIPAASPTAASAAPSPRATMSGGLSSRAAVDLRRDDDTEDTLDLLQQALLRLRYPFHPRWTAVIEGRLRWQMTGAADADAPTFVPDAASVQGRVEPELRDMYFAARYANWLVRVGQQTVVWGSGDVAKPSDVISPMDYRSGPTTSPGEARIPVPALEVTRAGSGLAASWVLVPFFVPHRFDVYGSDTALLGAPIDLPLPGGPVRISVDDVARAVIDPSLEPLVQPLLLQTELPEHTPRNLSFGNRYTLTRGGADVSLGWFFGWDRFPTLRLNTGAVEAATALATAAASGMLPAVDPAALGDAVADVLAAGPLWSAAYNRRHTVTTDAVKYIGPVGLRVDLAWSPKRTLYTNDLRSVRRGALFGSFGLSHESASEDLVLVAEVFHQHGFREDGDAAFLLGADRLTGVAVAVRLGLGRLVRGEAGRLEDVTVELGGLLLTRDLDWALTPAVALDATDRLTVRAGAQLGGGGEDGGIGHRLRRNDAAFLSLERRF